MILDFQECQKCEDTKLIEPFIHKTNHFLENQFNIKVNSIDVKQLEDSFEMNNITFLTTLSGALNTNLIFSFDRTLSKSLLENYEFITYTEESFDELLYEVVAEFLNLIVGRTMIDLPSSDRLRFSPPIEIVGNSKLFCNNSFNICKTDIHTSQGSMAIIFSTEK